MFRKIKLIMKNDLIKLLTSNEWNELSKEQRIDELQRQIDELKNETEYPVFCLAKNKRMAIVRFDSLKSGIVVKEGNYAFGYKFDDWVECTREDCWKQLPYNKECGLYHTQLVWCWNNNYTHVIELRFYDAINDCTFRFDGSIGGYKYDKIEPYQGEWPEWAIEAHKTLEGLND